MTVLYADSGKEINKQSNKRAQNKPEAADYYKNYQYKGSNTVDLVNRALIAGRQD